MHKLIAIVLAAAFIGVLIPGTQASESASRDYIAGGAVLAGRGLGVITCQSPGLGVEDLYPECEVLRALGYDGGVGGTHLTASTFYTNVIVSISDDFYGSEGAFSVCFWNPEGDNICDADEDYRTGVDCGVRALTGSPFAGDYVSVFTYTVAITEDLDVCGATAGTLTGNFF